MPLSEVQPGMVATVRTVFEGDRVEEFQAEIVAVMDNYLGPKQNLILARLKGDRVAFTGVAAGMSGSPVYIEGRLVGALSYRMGQFLKEPIAGITPIEYMLRVNEESSGGEQSGSPASASPSAGDEGLQPIETPFMIEGAPRRAIDIYAAELSRLGLGRILTGAMSGAGAARGAAPPSSSPGAKTDRAAPRAGDPIAAQLVTGDISFAATGTVTHVAGDRVYAFGHPAFFNGAADVPMARAEIYLTLASLQASNKMSRVLDTIGTFHQSRLPAMTGVLGPGPRMVPMTVRVTGTGGAGQARQYKYDVVDHKVFTPPLVGLMIASSLINTPYYSDEMTLSLSGRIGMAGHPDLVLKDLYSEIPGGQPTAAMLAGDVQGLFAAAFQNRWERPVITSVSLEISAVEKSHVSFVESVYSTRNVVSAGDAVELRAQIRPYRGATFTRRLSYSIPEGTPPGVLAFYVGGANLLGAAERNVLARQVSQAESLDQLLGLINRLRTSDKLYMKVARRQSGAIVLNEVMPALPPSVQSTLIANRGRGEVTPLAETTIHEESIPLDQLVSGGSVVVITVK